MLMTVMMNTLWDNWSKGVLHLPSGWAYAY